MASFGKVLDLLEDRYLHLQDVVGNVEPLPSLVSYEDYLQNILVYRMDTDHDVFLGLLHEFTAEKSHDLSQELWTWFVQWKVDANSALAPTSKKIRLDDTESRVHPSEDQKQGSDPIIDVFERTVLGSTLFEEEELLRCLIDIVQVESSIVPNYIEFLYRWVDYYVGDGKALKAALKWEIPSLWDFEHHPLLFPAELKKANERHRMMAAEERKLMLAGARQGGHDDKAAISDKPEELAGDSPKTIREKPDLAAMERQTEESERLQYREVKYGIQPPKLDTPMPPLINIPRNPAKREKYYAACYRSRQRALVILLEAGLTLKQIGSYERLQPEDVRDTPTDGVPDDTRKIHGMRHFHKDADAAQQYLQKKDKSRTQAEKQAEIATSEQLALEARRAAQNGATNGGSSTALIPPTPAYPRGPDMAADMLAKIRAARGQGEERINFVPTPLVGLMKSRLFEDAKDSRLMKGSNTSGQTQVEQMQRFVPREEEERESSSDEEMDSESGSDSDDDSDEDGAGPDASSSSNTTRSQALDHPFSIAAHPAAGPAHGSFNPAAATAPLPRLSWSPLPLSLAAPTALLQNLSHEEIQRLVPQMDESTRQELNGHITLQEARHPVPISTNPFTGTGPPGFGPPLPSQLSSIATTPSMGVYANPSMPASIPQPQIAFLPTPVRPPTTSTSPGTTRPTLPYTHPVVRPSGYGMPSTSAASGRYPVQQHSNFQAQSESFATSQHLPLPQTTLPPHQQNQQMAQGPSIFSGPPQITRTTQIIQPSRPMPQLPPLPQLPLRVPTQNQPLQSPARPSMPPLQGSHALAPPTPIPSSSSSSGPRSDQNASTTFENFLSMQRQRAAQAQGQAGSSAMLGETQDVRHSTAEQTQQRENASNLQGPPQAPAPSLQFAPPRPSITISTAPPQAGLPTFSGPDQLPRPSLLIPPRTLQRNTAPTPLSLAPPPASPLTSLAPSILCTTPFRTLPPEPKPKKLPILIYFPRILLPGLPRAFPLGDNFDTATDALMLGSIDSSQPFDSGIELSKALLMPTGCWNHVIGKVQRKRWSVMETYMSPVPAPFLSQMRKGDVVLGKNTVPDEGKMTPHYAAYTKLMTSLKLILSSAPSPYAREENLTKRWRATKGPMKWRDRGAVWEGYGVVVDKGIGISGKEREGAMVFGRRDEEEERRMQELEDEMDMEMEGMDFDWDE